MEQLAAKQKRFTKTEKSWILYDWANSVYATNIMAAIFPIYFASVAGDVGNKWWGVGVSLSSLVCAVLAPMLGAIADFRGYKKKLLAAFIALGVVFTAIMAFVGSWQWMLIGYVISRVGFSGANVFYDSFLTDVTTDERMDKVSSWGYAMGYLGGSTIPFLISIAYLMMTDFSVTAIKFSILITSVWWAAFSIPILLNVNQKFYVETPPKQLARNAGKNLLQTAKDCVTDKGMFIFLIAYFLYIDGVDSIISISTNYGATLGLGSTGMILALLVTQLVAVPFSILFSRFAKKFGAIKMILSAICMYFCICILGFVMGQMMEPHQMAYTAQVRSAQAAVSVPFAKGSQDAKVFEELVVNLVDDGKDQLASEDRVAAFDELFETMNNRVLDPAGVVYGFSCLESRAAASEALLEMKQIMAPYFADEEKVEAYGASLAGASTLFWILATLVGTVQGGIQALSRSYFGKLVPAERSAEFFGFYDIFGKFAAVLGPLLYAFFYMLTDRPSIGIISLIVLFACGAILLVAGRKQLEATEERVRLSRLAASGKEV